MYQQANRGYDVILFSHFGRAGALRGCFSGWARVLLLSAGSTPRKSEVPMQHLCCGKKNASTAAFYYYYYYYYNTTPPKKKKKKKKKMREDFL